MRTAPVRAGCTGATPAFHGQRAWTGNPPQTAIDRKPLQTDKLTGRAFDDEVYAVVAQRPLYIVNGVETEEIESIPPDDIENIESLPADEETIARYGEKAANGVILISLRYDKPAVFEAGTTFDEYIAGQVKWDDDEPAARIILRYTVTPEGKAVLAQELESTDNRLKRRVLKALSEAPHWHPAQKNGVAVASEGVLHIQLPKGKRMPRPVELVWR